MWPRIAAAVLVLAAAATIALRPAAVAQIPQVQRPWLLAALYAAITAASLLPAIPRDRAVLPAGRAALAGIAAVGLAWATAGPTAPLAVAPASVALSMAAAVAEESLFRRLAYGHLRRLGVPVAIGGAAALFALVHVPAYGTAALPVDLGAGLLFGWQRWASGTWTVPAATHCAANLLAVIR
jgi:membrane protease YdiL (CAAX protease family)